MVEATGDDNPLLIEGPKVSDEVLNTKLEYLPPVYPRRPILPVGKYLIHLVGLRGSPIFEYVTLMNVAPHYSALCIDFNDNAASSCTKVRDVFSRSSTVVAFGAGLGKKKLRKRILRPWKSDSSVFKVAAFVRETPEEWQERCNTIYRSMDPVELNRVWGAYREPEVGEGYNIVLDSLDKLLLLFYLMEV